MKKVGFLGCGKIGSAILGDIQEHHYAQVSFIQDPGYNGSDTVPIVSESREELLEGTDMVIETATAAVLKENIEAILKHCDLMVFSVTVFADEKFYKTGENLRQKYGHKIFLPHGAILGVDGISDGAQIIHSVTVETIKNPKSLGRDDIVRTILYDGTTRGACGVYPRNVNVHATVALAGIGFDKTHSKIIADPLVHTNTHHITVEGEGIHFTIDVSSFADGGVTGKYTPYSAVGSVRRVLGADSAFYFV